MGGPSSILLFSVLWGCDSSALDTAGSASTTSSPTTGTASTPIPGTSSDCPADPWTLAEPGDPVSLGPGAAPPDPDIIAELAAALLADPGVVAVAARESDERIGVHAAEGSSALLQSRDAEGALTFTWDPAPPLPDDPLALSTLESELAAGANPESTSYPAQGYEEGDPRLSFVATEDGSFPHTAARLAQIFDAANAPDLVYIRAAYARGGVGSHGGLSVAQSRAPLLLRGPGVAPGTHDVAARSVDIAPTVAALLGVPAVTGVDGQTGRMSSGQLLAWQDGRVLTELLDGDCLHGAAERAVVIVFDGLSHTELRDAIDAGRLPAFARIADGAVVGGGSIVGWPSFSFPGHLSVFTGAWQGHHGLLSNSFHDRAADAAAPGYDLSTLLVSASAAQEVADAYLSPDVETLFEAAARRDPDAVIASVNELTFRGATRSVLKDRRADTSASYSLADDAAVLQVGQIFEDSGPPLLLGLSFYLTDAAGEHTGPHGDTLRTRLEESDARFGQLLDLYAAAGAFEDTLFVVTADHGMELQDQARVADPGSVLGSHLNYSGLVYLQPSDDR